MAKVLLNTHKKESTGPDYWHPPSSVYIPKGKRLAFGLKLILWVLKLTQVDITLWVLANCQGAPMAERQALEGC